jgi:hypothetical protein
MQISPLVNSDRKGRAFQIMLQQSKRAIGVAIVQGNANYKHGYLHYVCVYVCVSWPPVTRGVTVKRTIPIASDPPQ